MMRVVSVGLLLVTASGLLAGQADAVSPLPPQVPFVGCPSRDAASGDPIAAPRGPARAAPVDYELAAQIAYYAGPGANWQPGVYAPRGWHCRAWSGADGAFLIVTPDPPPDTNLHAPIQGPGVMASLSIGGTGGRFEVAEIGARFFPNALRAFIQSVRDEGPLSQSVVRPYPSDIVTPAGEREVEFTNPASVEGYGTGGQYPWFAISDQPVRGVVSYSVAPPMASPSFPNLSEFDIRLGAESASLATALIQLEEQCLRRSRGC